VVVLVVVVVVVQSEQWSSCPAVGSTHDPGTPLSDWPAEQPGQSVRTYDVPRQMYVR
jgi:hypothetical protein